MKFKTHEERMQHPEARLIPQNTWNDYMVFNRELSDRFIPLMKANKDALMDEVAKVSYDNINQRYCAWLAVAYSHPDLDTAMLLELSQVMNLSDIHALTVATMYGRLDYVIELDKELTHRASRVWNSFGTKEKLFEMAGRFGHLSILRYFEENAPNKLQEMIAGNDYAAFQRAAQNGGLDILRYLEEKAPDKLQEMIAANDYAAFRRAAENGHLDILRYLEEKAPNKLQEMIAADNYHAFQYAVQNGHLDILRYLEEKAPDKLQKMIAENDYAAFRLAAENGHLDILQYLEEKAPDKLQEMIAGNDYAAFRLAAEKGHLDILLYLEEKAPDKLQKMIAADYYAAFRYAAEKGHLDILRYLEEKAQDKWQEMIAARDYAAFRWAAENGHLDILRYLEEKAQDKWQKMIAADDYAAFRLAAQNGHLDILQYLEEKAPDKLQEMIAGNDYAAFRWAAQNGHLDILLYLEEKAPDKLQEMIAANHYGAFQSAAANDCLDILRYLEEKAQDKWQEIIAENGYIAVAYAAENGHLDILRYLEEKAQDKWQEMIAANHSWAFQSAAREEHHNVVNHLLPYSSVFNYAEQHDFEYGERYVYPFIANKLNTLRVEKAAVEQENPNAVFDIQNEDEAKLVFYMIRNLIRRNSPECRDDLIFLLEIPAVKALAHTEVTAQIPNELLRLAVTQGNQMAAELLLSIPAVRELAEQHQFYREEALGALDLSALAHDRESSMTALTTGEQRRLEAVIARYEPLLKMKEVPNVMKELREMLKSRYENNPAKISLEDKELTLPFDWTAFKALELEDAEQKLALNAYYQHKDHSAWRYLSKPNPWMHEAAFYVYVNPHNPAERWSTFEEYSPLISLLFLAAQDKEIPAINDYTVDTRVEHFIDELAHIGRAHNWDKIRFKVDEKGSPLFDKEGNPIREEYDDSEGDKPSCFSGVKRRLFQAVQGHPLFVFLTKDILDEEVRDFVRDHWKKTINEDNQEALRAAWNNVIEGSGTDEDIKILQCLDVPPEAKALFKAQLITKYGDQFAKELAFMAQITNVFLIKENDAQVLNLGHLEPGQLFDAELTPKAAAGHVGFFTPNPKDHWDEGHPKAKRNDGHTTP